MGAPLSDRTRFPQLSPREIEILKAWLALHEKEFDRYDFNVRVGRGLDPGPTFTDSERATAQLNSKKRIDAVAYNGATPTILEVKDRAGTTAVGELLTYQTLYWLDHQDQAMPLLLLVTNSLQPDMGPVLSRFAVVVQLVTA